MQTNLPKRAAGFRSHIAFCAVVSAVILPVASLARDVPEKNRSHPILLDEREENDDVRSGCPRTIAWWATPSRSPNESAYFVGGGAPLFGEPRTREEGTWGRDYFHPFVPTQVRLHWWHGLRPQGGTGKYNTDRP